MDPELDEILFFHNPVVRIRNTENYPPSCVYFFITPSCLLSIHHQVSFSEAFSTFIAVIYCSYYVWNCLVLCYLGVRIHPGPAQSSDPRSLCPAPPAVTRPTVGSEPGFFKLLRSPRIDSKNQFFQAV